MSHSTSFLHDGSENGVSLALHRLEFKPKGDDFNEAWIQNLIAANPSILPIVDIEPAFTPAISVCIELPLPSGFLDNLLVTPKGDLIAVECKLWRNPQARREVVAQILDYASAMTHIGYAGLQAAIVAARRQPGFDLYAHVSAVCDDRDVLFEEAQFVDAVSRNLRLGRCLLLIAGDGIREEVEGMTEFLQQHAGMNFTLALVQLAVHHIPGRAERLIIPSVPMRTKTITRGVVRVEANGVSIQPVSEMSTQPARATSLSEDGFFAQLDDLRPKTSFRLRTFLESLQDLGVEFEVKKTLIVRMRVADQSFLPFVIYSNGTVDTDYVRRKDLMGPLVQGLIQAIPLTVRHETPKTIVIAKRKIDGSPFTIWDILEHQTGVREARKCKPEVIQPVHKHDAGHRDVQRTGVGKIG